MKHAQSFLFRQALTGTAGIGPPFHHVDVLGHDVISETADDVAAYLLDYGAKRCFFLNAHCVNVQARDPAYLAALRRADVILPDGVGVDLAARLCGQRIAANLNGTDFVPVLLRQAAQKGKSVFLFGGRPGTAERAAGRLRAELPDLRIAGTRDGYRGADADAAAVAEINASGADILLVAMGVPLQELWIDRHAGMLAPRLVLGVGALLDFLSGQVPRAPLTLRRMRIEWAWRLIIEPRRLWRRYLVGNPGFLARAIAYAWPRGLRADAAKYLADAGLSLLVLACLWPLFLLIALAIRLDDGGPVFFCQTRVGRNGRPFRVIKFRSMVTDAEARQAAQPLESDREGICFKATRDMRVTRVGRLLRRGSLDELPQIFNVLRGEMSLIGPRPALPSEVALYPARAFERLAAKPGITGIWQVAGRADLSFDKMVDMDVAYARSRSVLLDLLLLALTVRAVLSGRGAY